mmetsp:Transcript_11096/g.34026  ORF Transcript_11096/g.34026 Transcript_11096/m.34026 type:complete len:193 (-) Transcript_11096:1428-2006(-)
MSLYRATRNSLWRAVNRSSGRASSYGLGCCRNVSSSVLRRQESTAQLDPPNEKVQKLLEEILSLNMIEVRDLTSHLKSKLGVEDMPMGMPMMSAAAMQAPPAAQESKEESEGAEAAPVQEEKTIFNVKLESFSPDKKIALIKEIRAITGLGLRESKALVDEAPGMIKENVPKAEAEEIKSRVQELGGSVDLQ